MHTVEKINETVEELLADTRRFLCELIRFPSTSGNEHQAMEYLHNQFDKLDVSVEKTALSDSIKSDPDYSCPIPDITYDGRFNLRICKKGRGGGEGEKLLLNTHTDVVPASEGMSDPWSGKVEDDTVYGRGACDAKGQVATVYLLYKLLETLGIELEGDLVAHLVVEEENGGNGTLAMAHNGETAAGCIVLEPTKCRVLTSIRGAVWFKIEFFGKAGHSGQAGQTKSALLMARDAINILEKYQAELLKQSRGIEMFDKYPNPMPITFGRLTSGNWPASAPNNAVLEGVLGFLPNKTKEQICSEIKQVLIKKSKSLNEDNFSLTFTYKHDSSVIQPDHKLVRTLTAAADECGLHSEIDAMTASCDAWLYNNQLGIPTVVFGAGSLEVAHSKDEQIKMREIGRVVRILCCFVSKLCGVK